jgi:hypothetical protein
LSSVGHHCLIKVGPGFQLSLFQCFGKLLAIFPKNRSLTVTTVTNKACFSFREEVKEKKKSETRRKRKRYFLIGLATVGGGALIGLTGGLAAPLLAAGAGAIIGGAGAAALGTTAGIAIIGSLFGVAGAGLTGNKYGGGTSYKRHFAPKF